MRNYVKKFLLAGGILSVLFCAMIVVLVHFIFTPAKLTPLVQQYGETHIDGSFKIDSVDLTFFSTFPHFGLSIHQLDLKPTQSPQSLVSVERAVLAFDLSSLLLKKQIKIQTFSLLQPQIYLYVDSVGASNLNFWNDNSRKDAEKIDSSPESAPMDYTLDIRGIQIQQGDLVIDDRNKSLYGALKQFDLHLQGDFSQQSGQVEGTFQSENLLLWEKGRLLMNHIRLGMHTQASFHKDSLQVELGKTTIHLNGLKMGAQGMLQGDSVAQCLNVKVGFGITSGSLNELIQMVPASILDQTKSLQTQGEVRLTGLLEGSYGKDLFPLLTADMTIHKVSAKYAQAKLGIEELSAKAHLQVDLQHQLPSYLQVDQFLLKAGSGTVELDLSGQVDNLLKDPQVDISLKSNLQLEKLLEIFPLKQGIEFSGENHSKIQCHFKLSELQRGDYGRLKVMGNSRFKDLHILLQAPSDTLSSTAPAYLFVRMEEGSFDFNSLEGLGGAIHLNGIGFKDKHGVEFFMRDIGAQLQTKRQIRQDHVAEMDCKLLLGGIRLDVADSLQARLSHSELSVHISPSERNPSYSVIKTLLQTDSLYLHAYQTQTKATLNRALLDGQMIAPSEGGGKWRMRGTLAFDQLNLFSEIFPVEIKMPSSKIAYTKGTVLLKDTELQIGNSYLKASGQIDSLMPLLMGEHTKLKGNLRIESELLNLDPILTAMNQASLQSLEVPSVTNPVVDSKTPSITQVPDSTSSIFLIPEHLDFDLSVDLKQTLLSGLSFYDLKGLIELKEGKARLSNLSLDAVGAKMRTSALYTPLNPTHATAGLNLELKQVDISRLNELLPSMDSILPMLQSLSGMVDLSLVAQSRLDSKLEFELSSLSSVIRITGHDLVVLDGETFKRLSKLLMFKDKKKNMIQSLSAHVLVENGQVTVLPFEAKMDRYRLIIGGKQDFDMNFNYNVSIMESPLPFKAGVDVFGNLDDFDFKLTKAKLKKSDFGMQTVEVEDKRMQLIRQGALWLKADTIHEDDNEVLHLSE